MKAEQPQDSTPRLFSWACCDCGQSEKDTIPLHAFEQGKRVIKAICFDCLALRIERTLAQRMRLSGGIRL